MIVRATQDFLHGRARFAAGRHYDVPDALGTYFTLNGWADDAPAADPARVIAVDPNALPAAASAKTGPLDIDDAGSTAAAWPAAHRR